MIKQSTTHRLLTIILVMTLFIAALISSTLTTQADEAVFENIELKLGESIGFVYYTNQPYTDDTVMRFEINGRKSDVKAIQNGQTCAFVFEDIYPHELAKPIKATILVNGNVGASKQDITVRDYLLDIILTSDSEQKIKLASNLLQYGEMTREYRNENVDATLQDDKSILEFDETIYKKYYDYVDNLDDRLDGTVAELGIGSHDIRFTSVGISYHNTNQYVVQLVIPSNIQIPPEDIEVRIGEKTYYHEDLEPTNTPGVYEVRSEPIHAYNIYNQSILIELSVAGQVVQQARYGCKDYILQLQNVAPNSRAENYAQSLYYYGKSASELYQGATIIAIKPQSEPLPDITLISNQPHKPAPGQGIAYMSDGSTKAINIDCDPVEAIQDDTYSVTRDVVGKYTDEINGRVHEVKFKVTLFNPLKEIERHTDPFPYILPSSATMLKPQQCKVLARWANGFEEVRDAEASAITDASIIQSILQKPFTPQPIQLSYTDPKSNITKELPQNNLAVWPLYNPATNVTITNSATLTFDNGTYLSISPDMFTYQATLNNGHTFVTSDVTELGTATFSNAVYTGQEQSGTITIKGTLEQRHSIIGRYEDGELQDNYVFFFDTLNLVADVAFSNPIMSIQIKDFPTCSLSNMKAPTSDNGMLTGGSIYVTLGNGTSSVITGDQVKYEADQGITDASYSKMVTITATYNNMTATGNMTITNPITMIGQTQEVYIPASYYSQVYTTILPEHFANRVSVKYANGVMEPITPMALRVVDQADVDKLYAPNIRDNSATTSRLTYAYPDDTLTERGMFMAVYKDTREGANYPAITSNTLRYYVVNTPKELEGSTIIPLLAEKDPSLPFLTSVSSITHSARLMNGTYKNIAITKFEPIPNVQTATESITAKVAVTYTENNQTLSDEIYVYVYNPVVKILGVHSSPKQITVTNTNTITSNDIQKAPGSLSVQLHNGLNTYVAPQSFTNLDDAYIADDTMTKMCIVDAVYKSTLGEQLQYPVNLLLLNPPMAAVVTLDSGSSTNKLVLAPTAQSVTFADCKIKYSNQQVSSIDCTPQTIPQIFKSGTNVDGEATINETGEQQFDVSIAYDASETYNIMVDGETLNYTMPADIVSTRVTVYWKNIVKSIKVTNIKCISVTSGNPVPTDVKVTVTYNNNATATNQSASASAVDNLTGFSASSASRTTTVTYTATHGQQISISHTFTMYNPITRIVYATSSNSFFAPTELIGSATTTASNVYVIYRASGNYSTIGSPTHNTYKTPWLNMSLSSKNGSVSFSSNNTATPKITYTGSNVEVTINCTATLNSSAVRTPYDVTTCTHTLTLINTPSVKNTYSTETDTNKENSLKVNAWYEDTAPTVKVELEVVGANGVSLGVTELLATNTLSKGTGAKLYALQDGTVATTDTYSSSCEKRLSFSGTYEGHDVNTIITCYVYNEFNRYEYAVTGLTRVQNSTYSPSDFTATLTVYKTCTNGYKTVINTIKWSDATKFYVHTSSTTTNNCIEAHTIRSQNVKSFEYTTIYNSLYPGSTMWFAVALPEELYGINVDNVGGLDTIYVYHGTSGKEQFLQNAFSPISNFFKL